WTPPFFEKSNAPRIEGRASAAAAPPAARETEETTATMPRQVLLAGAGAPGAEKMEPDLMG
ncbi:MAG: hypothetical protein ACWGSQ_16385, partial [Longimicrobiales bacterium]